MEISNPADVIRACAETNSKTEKVTILKKYESEALRFIIRMALSPYEMFGIKQYEFAESIGGDDFSNNWKHVLFCIHHLRSRDVKDPRGFIKETSKQLNADQQYCFKCILDKDLGGGIGIKTANAAYPDLIPEFTVQLANVIEFTKVVYPCYAEVKFNGERNIAVVIGGKVTHYSRKGLEKENYHTFDEELIALARGNDLVFDGEVIGAKGENREERRAVQKQARRKYNVDTSNLVFVVWDMVPVGCWKLKQCNLPFKQRYAELKASYYEWLDNCQLSTIRLKLSKANVVKSEEQLKVIYTKAISDGREGVMVKDPNGRYEFKRSWAWMKLKPNERSDNEIIDVIEGKKGRAGTLGSVVVDVNGVHVRCGIGEGMSVEQAREMWENKEDLIGKIAEISYTSITLDGSLLGAKLIRLREDK